jgi:hypothetical protein
MSKYDRDAIEIYILDHIDTDNYGKQFKYDREYLSFMLNVFKDEYKYHPAMRKPCNRLLLIPLPLFLKHCPYYLYLIKLCQGAGNRPRTISAHVRSWYSFRPAKAWFNINKLSYPHTS